MAASICYLGWTTACAKEALSMPPVSSVSPVRRSWPRLVAGIVVGGCVAVAARESRADQFILMDAMITYTWDDAENAKPDKSHFYVNDKNFMNKNRPINWLSPIDYRNGVLHVRAEVFEKPPGTQTTGWTLCYIPNAGPSYGCADTTYYTATGVWEREVKMTDWWNNDQLDWTKGVKQLDMIYAINDSGSGHVTNYPALMNLTTPTRVRVTMVQISAGAKYDPSILSTVGIGVDGGASDGGGTDVAAPVDGGGGGAGAGGSNGRSGSGGTTVIGTGGASGSGGATTTPTTGSGGSAGSSTGSGGSAPGAGISSSSSGCALSGRSNAGGGGAVMMGLALGAWFAARRKRQRR
ncbi:MAG TPA: hypothetical protein VH374_02055 [Polyangia bacterium]|nr:hypothetical protein [Polyangia bacterium]